MLRNTLLRGLLAASLCLAATAPAVAQHDPSFWCTPKTTATPSGVGSETVIVIRLDGGAAGWWCPIILPDGRPGYRAYTWAGLASYGMSKVTAAAERVQAATLPVVQAQAEVNAGAASAANEVDACKHRMLRREACVALRTKDMGPGYPVPVTAASAAMFCGAAQNCAALPPPPVVWRATGGSIYSVLNGRIGLPTGRRAIAAAPGDCSVLHIVNTTGGIASDYCPLQGASQAEVTLVKKAS